MAFFGSVKTCGGLKALSKFLSASTVYSLKLCGANYDGANYDGAKLYTVSQPKRKSGVII